MKWKKNRKQNWKPLQVPLLDKDEKGRTIVRVVLYDEKNEELCYVVVPSYKKWTEMKEIQDAED